MSTNATCLGCGCPIVRGTGYRYSRCVPCANIKAKQWRVEFEVRYPDKRTRVCPLIPDSRLFGRRTAWDAPAVTPVDAPNLATSTRCGHCLLEIPSASRSVNYCSNACSQRANNAGRRPVRGCVVCSATLPPNHAKYCSLGCRRHQPSGQTIECMICKATFTRNGNRTAKCCSPECSLEAKRERSRRKNRARRMKRKPGAYVLQQIAERDGRRCHICGKKVDMRLSGMKPNGPSIDHLIPLSEGGDDTPENVALAHRQCNVNRSVGGEVQLRLVG